MNEGDPTASVRSQDPFPTETAGLPECRRSEIVELADHPWFVGTQFHGEYRSRPNRPHPLYREFIAAALRQTQHPATHLPQEPFTPAANR